jgi:hypothetical protein
MYWEEKITFCLIVLLGIASLATMTLGQGQQEWAGMPMNASIQQVACIILSGNLSQGIFFTNGSSIGLPQVPISLMDVKNNATGNYWGPSSTTVYNVTSCSGVTINQSVYLSACDNLMNGTQNYINLTWYATGSQGAFFGNDTSNSAASPSLSATQNYSFKVDDYVMVAYKLDVNQNIYLRFWLDPWPNNAPTGIYNTTYKIRAVDYTQSPGSGVC